MNQSAVKPKAPQQEKSSSQPQLQASPPPKPTRFIKRIGSGYYEVSVYFSETNKESINDKIHRLIRNEVVNGKAVE